MVGVPLTCMATPPGSMASYWPGMATPRPISTPESRMR
ncbi:Uncharacterised protein [Bordetella pertussis]|nr:Uncharacterised protein [Bordetella pertussis]